MYLEKPLLYSLRYDTPKGFGTGVAVVHNNGTILGGDTSFYFRGSIIEENDEVEIDFYTGRHAEGLISIFTDDENHVVMKGKKNTDGFTVFDPTGNVRITALLIPE